jgi:hypothetical protein
MRDHISDVSVPCELHRYSPSERYGANVVNHVQVDLGPAESL